MAQFYALIRPVESSQYQRHLLLISEHLQKDALRRIAKQRRFAIRFGTEILDDFGFDKGKKYSIIYLSDITVSHLRLEGSRIHQPIRFEVTWMVNELRLQYRSAIHSEDVQSRFSTDSRTIFGHEIRNRSENYQWTVVWFMVSSRSIGYIGGFWSKQADIYSLGVILSEILSRKTPFNVDTSNSNEIESKYRGRL